MPSVGQKSVWSGGREQTLTPQTERPITADREGVAELFALLRALLEGATASAHPVPAGAVVADDRTCPSWPHTTGGCPDDTRLLQASHQETAEARPASLSFHRAGVRTEQETTQDPRIVALVELAKDGDAEAFGQLYDHYVSTIYRYIYYRVGTHALAEDLTSETFFRALRALSSFRWQGRDFGAWLVTIARNLVTDHFKSGRFRLEVATGEILDYDLAADGPEDDVLATLTNEELVKAVRKLKPDQQECLVLRFLNGLSVAETAQVLSKSEGAVKQLQLRAVRNLAKLLPKGIR
ncbi:RNA polymerase sigma-70 factor (ECF subfamily) [Thermasporomyces composti]|jgi:RNA polymerase sigma-70 factor (ECF subfamily)|uniref:RNA polymerase sigma-70 factor (ECF subfamily) n=1 Tax=Thermasporomyces composti TaxID=696763 RepID=A0A3D9VA92_THECX|nr:RNA polymerase sigma-70 factor (ECF subfamily) [Thermasporomyces composti]